MDLPGTWFVNPRTGETCFNEAFVGDATYNEYQLCRTDDLNKLQWACESSPRDLVEPGPSEFINAAVKPVFRDIESTLVKRIREADVVIGCMAWLTSKPILLALAEKDQGVQIVVQQEDWLRPDSTDWTMKEQRRLYRQLRPIFSGFSELSWGWGGYIQPIRLSGAPKNDKRNNPRMHHKFLIFCHDEEGCELTPKSVWTGSFNATKNGSNSLENGLLIDSPEIAAIYKQEWRQVLMTSKRIGSRDWNRKYQDEYLRDGT